MADIPLVNSYPSLAINPTAAAAAGDTRPNPGDVLLVVKNAAAAAITVTAVTPKEFAGVAIADLAVSVAAGETRAIGPFDPAAFNDGDGKVAINYSATASVTRQAVRVIRG